MSRTDVPRFPLRRRRVTCRDPELEHQIYLGFINGTGQIGVSCNCLADGQGHAWLAMRKVWENGEYWDIYRQHLLQVVKDA